MFGIVLLKTEKKSEKKSAPGEFPAEILYAIFLDSFFFWFCIDEGTPSPSRKKRNNSTPTKNKAIEKQLILETLIAPATIDIRPKVSINALRECTRRVNALLQLNYYCRNRTHYSYQNIKSAGFLCERYAILDELG